MITQDNFHKITQSLGLTVLQLSEMPQQELIKLMKSKQEYQEIVVNDLIQAILRGDCKYVQFMLMNDALDINTNPDNSGTPLMHAVANGQHNIVNILLNDTRIDVNAQIDGKGLTALMLAAGCNDIKSIKALLENKKTDVNRQDFLGRTALMYIMLQDQPSKDRAQEDSIEAAKILLNDKRIIINICNNDGLSAENMAAKHGFVKIKNLLNTARSAYNSGCIAAANIHNANDAINDKHAKSSANRCRT